MARVKVGVVVVTHYRLGEEFLQALRLIVPDAPAFYAVGVEPDQPVDEMRKAIAAALKTYPKWSLAQIRVSENYQDEAEMDRYLDLLRQAGMPE